jgi:hypothetical protein
MIKITLPSSWNFSEPVARLVDVHSRGVDGAWLEKRAAAGMFKHVDIQPVKGHSLIHLIALGDAEVYGGNRNGDWFYGTGRKLELPEGNWDRVWLEKAAVDAANPTGPKGRWDCRSPATFTDQVLYGNKERMSTFIKYANVYRNHANKPFEHVDPDWKPENGGKPKMMPPDKVYGSVKLAAHNDRMCRGELMIEVPHGPDWDHQLEKLARGEDVPFSMASKVPFDICMACGHKARTLEEYCPHLTHMTEMTKSGNVHGVANDEASFFDISDVPKPADRIAWSLYHVMEKAAGYGGHTKSAAELGQHASHYGLHQPVSVMGLYLDANTSRRLGLLQKAAELEKQIPLLAKASPIAKGIKHDLIADTSILKKCARAQLPEYFKALADAGVCLPLVKWAQLIGLHEDPRFSASVKIACQLLPEAFGRSLVLAGDKVAGNCAYDPYHRLPAADLRKQAADLSSPLGVLPEMVNARAVRNTLRGDGTMRVKQAAVTVTDPVADGLVQEYVSYKLAFLDEVHRTRPQLLDFVTEAIVLQNLL